MGGNQASSVLATVKRDQYEARGEEWPAEDEEAFKDNIRQQYEVQGHPYYATGRLWDDGVIDPADTRRVLALGLSAMLLLGAVTQAVFYVPQKQYEDCMQGANTSAAQTVCSQERQRSILGSLTEF